MSISKKIRFEIFKRDNFTCQYCGNHPPEVILEIDHIIPKSKSGSDEINNLITSCFNCNRGKSNIELDKIPNVLIENKEIIEERENQYIEYQKLLKKIERRINKEVNDIQKIYKTYFNDYLFTDKFKISVRMFIEKIGYHEVKKSMVAACIKLHGSKQYWRTNISANEAAIKYFCGICWNKIKNQENG